MNKDTDNKIEDLEEEVKEIRETSGVLGKFKKKYPGIVVLIIIISAFGTIFTSANLLFGVQVRPAWHWEYIKVRQEVIALQIQQLDLSRILLSRDLSRFESLREGYIKRGDTVPDWLDEEIATMRVGVTRIGEEIHKHKKNQH